MDEVIEKASAITGITQDIAQEILVWVKAAGELAAEQAPLLADEVIRRGLVMESMDAVWALLWLVGSLTVGRIAYKWLRQGIDIIYDSDRSRYHNDDEIPFMFGGIGGCVAAMLGTLISTGALYNAVQQILLISLAPRIYLLEQLSRLVN